MVRFLQAFAAWLVPAFVAATPATASTRSAAFSVSARVVARTWIEPVDAPATILITRADLEQGYKLLDVHYRVHTAGTPRYLLNFEPLTGVADRIAIQGLGTPVRLGSTELTVLQPAPAHVNELRLRLRFELRSDLAAGQYAMPVRMWVSAS
jgi:hypothetical protein